MSATAPRLPVINRSREYYGMIGAGAAMQQVFATIERVAPFIRSTLISGETGTGKELAARALHKAGRRSERRFVTTNSRHSSKVNCLDMLAARSPARR
jgi:DNA-binding NtrC family response regulator